MAKDPAINWYFDNWSGGTKGFSRHQKGCYMDLLEAQFYLGPLSLEQVKNILGPDFNQWNFLIKKFQKTQNGDFFNERMESEKQKRLRYLQSRKNGKAGRKKSQENHMINHMTNHEQITLGIENGIKNDFKEGGPGEETFYTIEHCAVVALNDPRWVKANKADEKTLLEFNAYLEKQGVYEKNPMEYKKHFSNWFKKLNDGNKNGSHRQGNTHRAVITGTATGAGSL